MPARFAAGFDAEDFSVDDLLAMQDDKPVHGTDEGEIMIAPAHRFGDRQRLQRFGDDVLHQRRGRLAGLFAARDEALALGVARALQVFDSDAAFCGESAQRRHRRSGCVQSDVQIRTEHFGFLRWLHGRNIGHDGGESTRRIVYFCASSIDSDTALGQPFAKASYECCRQLVQCLGRQFLGADFDQQRFQIGHHAASANFSLSPKLCLGERVGVRGERHALPLRRAEPTCCPLTLPSPPCGHGGEGIQRVLIELLQDVNITPPPCHASRAISRVAQHNFPLPRARWCAHAGCSAGVRSR